MTEIDRRKFLLTLAAVPFAAIANVNGNVRKPVSILPARPVSYPRIDQILKVSWEAASREVLDGRNWTAPELDSEFVTFESLGLVVEVDGKLYPVQELSIPMVWSSTDDALPEHDKIDMVARMIENALHTHDFVLAEDWLPDHRLIVSKEYHHVLGEPQAIEDAAVAAYENRTGEVGRYHYVCKLYSVFVAVPR